MKKLVPALIMIFVSGAATAKSEPINFTLSVGAGRNEMVSVRQKKIANKLVCYLAYKNKTSDHIEKVLPSSECPKLAREIREITSELRLAYLQRPLVSCHEEIAMKNGRDTEELCISNATEEQRKKLHDWLRTQSILARGL